MSFGLVFVSIYLFCEIDNMGLRVWVDIRWALPYVTVVFVMLITVVVWVLTPPLFTSLCHAKIYQTFLGWTDFIQVVVVASEVHCSSPLFLSFYPTEVYLFADTALDVLQRMHYIRLTPIHTLQSLLFAASHPGHVDHALAVVIWLHEGRTDRLHEGFALSLIELI